MRFLRRSEHRKGKQHIIRAVSYTHLDQSIYKKDRYGKEFQAYGGDFGERPTDYNFSGNGIAYGGNRDASPKMQEVKFNYQNIAAEVSADSVKVINKNLFVNTDMFDCKVTVAKNGKVIRKASLATAVAPLSEEVYALPLAKEEKPGEYAVTVSFHLKEDKVWAEAGHEVAFGQYVYLALIHIFRNMEGTAPHWHESVARYKKNGGTEKIKKDVYKRQVVANVVTWGIASINGMVVAALCYVIGELVSKNK